jgi:ketosteroid isomerase-like protein
VQYAAWNPRAMAWVAMMVLVGAAIPRSEAASAPAFRAALEAHLAAVSARNLDALIPTLTSGNKLTMIAPNGYKWDTRQQFIDFHREWFAEKDDGKFETEIVSVTESPALAHALIKYRYSSKDAGGAPQSTVSWLALTFALESGSWRLVFDQNTRIADPAAR